MTGRGVTGRGAGCADRRGPRTAVAGTDAMVSAFVQTERLRDQLGGEA